MALITKPHTYAAGGTVIAAEHNANDDTIYNDYNGGITAANLASNLALPDTQLAQIATASKVSGAAITLLTSLPSGAGVVPTANLGSGSASATTYLKGDQTYAAATPTAASSLSGSVIQTVNVQLTTPVSVTATVTEDDTPPLYSEGNAIGSLAITPNNASNYLLIRMSLWGTFSTTNRAYFWINDATGSDEALTARVDFSSAANGNANIYLEYYVAAGGTSAITYYLMGGVSSGTFYAGKAAAADWFGAASYGSITIQEIKA